MIKQDTVIVVFLRSPNAPLKKTRLAKELGKLDANQVYQILVNKILKDVQQICDYAAVLVDGTIPVVDTVENLRRPLSPSYQVRITGNAEQFMQLARENNVVPSVSPVGVITLEAQGGLTEEDIWQWAFDTSAGVQSIVPAKVSMEDVFIQVVQEMQHGYQ